MAVLIRDLLSDENLRLVAHNDHCYISREPLSWVATTELPRPARFLRGGELVLTTGLRDRPESEWVDYVRRLARVPIAGLCFGTGLVHESVPRAVVAAADAAKLPLLESRVDVPFIQIAQWVAERLYAEKYNDIRTLAVMQDDLIRSVTSDQGLDAMLRVLQRHLSGAPVALVTPFGEIIASSFSEGDPHELLEQPLRKDGTRQIIPVSLEGTDAAYLVVSTPVEMPTILPFSANIIAMELARQQAIATGQRELLGQILQEFFQGMTAEAEAARRLSHANVDLEKPYRVIVVATSVTKDLLRRLPLRLRSLVKSGADTLLLALIENQLVALFPGDDGPEEFAKELFRELHALRLSPSVGISSLRRTAHGLRIGYYEARSAASGRAGIHHAAPLTLSGLLLGNLGLPIRQLALETLGPVIEYDERNRGHLLETLRVYLQNDGAIVQASKALSLHRNSLRYRLELINSLTRRDLGTLFDRLELALALQALDIES